MSTQILFPNRDSRVLPAGIDAGSHAGHRLSILINAHLQKRAAGTVLKLEGETNGSVYLVLSGWICVSKSMVDGHRQIVDIVLPGGVLEPATADISTSGVEIQALTDVTCAVIPREIWQRFVDANPELGLMLQREIGAAMTRMSERMLRLGKGTAESIIAFVFCELCLRSTGLSLWEVRKFHIPMTQQQLGDLCGLSSVHICRTLRRFKRNGVLDVRDHMEVTFHDIDTLADIAQIDPDALQNELVPRAAPLPLKICS